MVGRSTLASSWTAYKSPGASETIRSNADMAWGEPLVSGQEQAQFGLSGPSVGTGNRGSRARALRCCPTATAVTALPMSASMSSGANRRIFW